MFTKCLKQEKILSVIKLEYITVEKRLICQNVRQQTVQKSPCYCKWNLLDNENRFDVESVNGAVICITSEYEVWLRNRTFLLTFLYTF